MDSKLSFAYPWKILTDEMYPRIIREFLDNGVDCFVLTQTLTDRARLEPDFKAFLEKLQREFHCRFVSAHAPFGRDYDLNIPEGRENMINAHIKAMEIAAEFGSQTYTLHVGAAHYCHDHIPLEPLRKNAFASLDRLVPEAERIGIIIAVENSFEPPNTPHEVKALITPYLSSPAIGVCFDTGHAQVMATAPWKKLECYPAYVQNSWWEHGIINEPNALEILKDWVVTTHIHDNNGYSDLHGMPGDGTIDWVNQMAQLRACRKMLEFQTEVYLLDGHNWAGDLLAPVGGYSVKRLVDTFRDLGF